MIGERRPLGSGTFGAVYAACLDLAFKTPSPEGDLVQVRDYKVPSMLYPAHIAPDFILVFCTYYNTVKHQQRGCCPLTAHRAYID